MVALDTLVRSGKVRAIGCSNYAAWRLVESNVRSSAMNTAGFVSIQREYNLLKRSAESECVDACRTFKVTLIPYFPLASGLLWRETVRGTERWKVGDVARPAYIDQVSRVLAGLAAFARDANHTLGELAIAWLASHDIVGPVITGIRDVDQLRANVLAANWRLSSEEMATVNALSSMGEEVRADDPFGKLGASRT